MHYTFLQRPASNCTMEEATTAVSFQELPHELLIHIISRIDSDNPVELMCISKMWKSLVVDHVFVRNHVFRSLINFSDLNHKNSKRFLAACKLQEEEDDDDDNEEEDDKEEKKGGKKEKQFMVKWLAERDNLDEEEVDQWAINNAAMIIKIYTALGFIRNIRPVVKLLDDIEISNENVEAMRADMESMEVRVKCLENFIRIYLKRGSISSQ
ncbi:putative F-box domain-containing protein [Medicago truncatula]|uniref:Putative F-box domain-containing protein n=1 Tax=Medicago truncatula TaxID=3880 RepID=G7I7U0_MEDTR|nr:hypothetical protein MTR_1g025850 [Medicago truncatula]RHN77642.1 putative F-box domain-containing protein [Medicago truncatula]